MARRPGLLLVALLLATASCVGGEPEAPRPPGRSPGPTATPGESPGRDDRPRPRPLSRVRLRLRRVATLEQPLALTVRAGDEALYVAEKTGRVVAIRRGRVDRTPVLDLRGQVSLGTEQGLLGLAFAPDGGFVYVNYTDGEGDTRIVEYVMGRRRARAGTRREVLTVDQPYANHNGGNLVFGPDGHLYVGLGDGGSGGDPLGAAQSLDVLLGKMLRVDPRPEDGRSYGVPDDNPFVGRPGARPEVWAYGLRNPWRYSFDRATGDLWIGDVGQNAWEEIDRQPADSNGGENYGWDRLEGSHVYDPPAPPEHVLPVYEYPTSGGACAVVGGHVYRGERIPGLQGAYLFGDNCLGRVMALRLRPGGGPVRARHLGPVVPALASFGEDADGELYVLSLAGSVYRLTG